MGRVVTAADSLGNTVKHQYNNLNLLTQSTDSQGHNISLTYDGNGNLLTLTDPLNHTTSYTYDSMDRTLTRTDPLNRQEKYTYDANGNLASGVDRKGQVTAFTYDGLDRTTLVGFGAVVNGSSTSYQGTIAYIYDAGNRLTQAVDSADGTITDVYDGLNRLTSETTSMGSLTYGYDAASRQTTMQVTGQPQVSYTYDNANRLTQIAQSGSTVGFGYDNANRRTSLTLPNGVTVSYGYDNDSRLTGITYQLGTNTLGNLSYTYDQANRRTQMNGTFARTGLPGAVNVTTYDAANELTNWNGLIISYDNNGNMLSDGSNTLTWNSRNRAASINGISLQYDAFGRRIQNLQGISLLYDGANAVQELSGSTVTANFLNGGVDESFSQAGSGGTFIPLKDALGSTIALVNSSGNVQTSYTYDPFGNTSVSGSSNANEFQYTARENEGNGLYFYRNRYYSPLFGRFLAEDPLGLLAGINLYRYVDDSPTSYTDPSGDDKKNPVCGYLPQARTEGLSVAGGILAGPTFGIERVVNYNTGKVNIYTYDGAQIYYLNGGGSATGETGLIFKTDNNYKDTDYSGGFTSISAAASIPDTPLSVGVYGSISSGGPSHPLKVDKNGVKSFGITGSIAPILPIGGKGGFGGSATDYSAPHSDGDVISNPDANSGLQLFDLANIAIRDAACK